MKNIREKILKILEEGKIYDYNNESISNEILVLFLEIEEEMEEEREEFGRKAFYKGREIRGYDERGNAIFKRPTYNGYLRELSGQLISTDDEKEKLKI